MTNKGTENKTGYEFVTENERGAITRNFLGSAVIGNAQMGTAVIGTANIGTLSFNQITGGTAILGGTNNGSGVFNLRSSTGSQIIKMDSTGLVVLDGLGGTRTTIGTDGIFTQKEGNIVFTTGTFVEPAFIGFGTSIGVGTGLTIEVLGYNIELETDDGNIYLSAGGNNIVAKVGTATASRFRIVTPAGTRMELTPSGDLRIAGTLGTGIVFWYNTIIFKYHNHQWETLLN